MLPASELWVQIFELFCWLLGVVAACVVIDRYLIEPAASEAVGLSEYEIKWEQLECDFEQAARDRDELDAELRGVTEDVRWVRDEGLANIARLREQLRPQLQALQLPRDECEAAVVGCRVLWSMAEQVLVGRLGPIVRAHESKMRSGEADAGADEARTLALFRDLLPDVEVPRAPAAEGAAFDTIRLSPDAKRPPASLADLARSVSAVGRGEQERIFRRRSAEAAMLDLIREEALPRLDAARAAAPQEAAARMARLGLELIDPAYGDASDPRLHEELAADDPTPDCPQGHVLRVVKPGYLWESLVLRRAQIMVAAEE